MNVENTGIPDQVQQMRENIRNLLEEITAALSDLQKKRVLEILAAKINGSDVDSVVPLQNFTSIFPRCQNARSIQALHDAYAAHPEAAKSVVGILVQEQRTTHSRAVQQRQQRQRERVAKIRRLLGIIFQATTVEGEEIAYLTEMLP